MRIFMGGFIRCFLRGCQSVRRRTSLSCHFDWYYDDTEECYLLEGKVIVETEDGEKAEFGKGDYVTFPKRLSCVWDIKEPVKKHYTFK